MSIILVLAAALGTPVPAATPSADSSPVPTPVPTYTGTRPGGGYGPSPTIAPMPTPVPTRSADLATSNCVKIGSAKPCYAISSFSIVVPRPLSIHALPGTQVRPSTFEMTRRTDAASSLFAVTPERITGLGQEPPRPTWFVNFRGVNYVLLVPRVLHFTQSGGVDSMSGSFSGNGKPGPSPV